MADDASRLWNLSDNEFLTYFNSTYPQHISWTLCPPPKLMTSLLTSALLTEESNMASVRLALAKQPPPGASGPSSVLPSTPTRASATLTTPWSPYSSLASAGVTVALHPKGNRSWLAHQNMRCAKWVIPFPNWGSWTRA